MTGAEMERAIEFLLKNQATHDERIERTQAQIGEMQTQLSETQAQLSELGRVVQMQAEAQGQFNQTVTTAITALAEAQTKTEANVERIAGIVETLIERLSP